MSEDSAEPQMHIEFSTTGGYEPMSSVVGGNITDIALTPDLDLLLVDQASEGLVKFDLKGGFGVQGHSVN